jgi:hypothetical protein
MRAGPSPRVPSLVRHADWHAQHIARRHREPLVTDSVLERALDQVEQLLAVVVPVQRVGVAGVDRDLAQRHVGAGHPSGVHMPAQLAEFGEIGRDIGPARQTSLLHGEGS